MSEAGIQQLDVIAEETGTKRSEVVRALLAEAMQSRTVLRAARARLTRRDA